MLGVVASRALGFTKLFELQGCGNYGFRFAAKGLKTSLSFWEDVEPGTCGCFEDIVIYRDEGTGIQTPNAQELREASGDALHVGFAQAVFGLGFEAFGLRA